MARDGHAAVCLGWGDNAQLLITGGSDSSYCTLSDVWMLNMRLGKWKEVSVVLYMDQVQFVTWLLAKYPP